MGKEALIQVPDHPEIKKILKTDASTISYVSCFSSDGKYLLEDAVRSAQAMMPKDQGTFEKESSNLMSE
jgi:hypothetical protein